MEITQAYIKVVQKSAIMATVDIVLDEALKICGLKIIHSTAQGDLFVSFPSRSTLYGQFVNIVHPINRAFREEVTNELVNRYIAICEEQGFEAIPAARLEQVTHIAPEASGPQTSEG